MVWVMYGMRAAVTSLALVFSPTTRNTCPSGGTPSTPAAASWDPRDPLPHPVVDSPTTIASATPARGRASVTTAIVLRKATTGIEPVVALRRFTTGVLAVLARP